jgi:hypothetical protein
VLAMGLSLIGCAVGADSVVLGHGISNRFLSHQGCSPDAVCLDASYVWVLQAQRTVAGTPITGTIRAISSQHTEARPEFARSVELFVLRAIEDRKLRRLSGADFYIISLSSRDANGRYCVSVEPDRIGLHLDAAKIAIGDNGTFCFDAASLGGV